MPTIHHHGQFVRALSALVSGDLETVTSDLWWGLNGQGQLVPILDSRLQELESFGFHQQTDSGCCWIIHPDLGAVRWYRPRSAREAFLVIWCGGEVPVLTAYRGPDATWTRWLAPAAPPLTNHEALALLGSL